MTSELLSKLHLIEVSSHNCAMKLNNVFNSVTNTKKSIKQSNYCSDNNINNNNSSSKDLCTDINIPIINTATTTNAAITSNSSNSLVVSDNLVHCTANANITADMINNNNNNSSVSDEYNSHQLHSTSTHSSLSIDDSNRLSSPVSITNNNYNSKIDVITTVSANHIVTNVLSIGASQTTSNGQYLCTGGFRYHVRRPVESWKFYETSRTDGSIIYLCRLCGSSYKHKKSLNKHWKDKHTDLALNNCPELNENNKQVYHSKPEEEEEEEEDDDDDDNDDDEVENESDMDVKRSSFVYGDEQFENLPITLHGTLKSNDRDTENVENCSIPFQNRPLKLSYSSQHDSQFKRSYSNLHDRIKPTSQKRLSTPLERSYPPILPKRFSHVPIHCSEIPSNDNNSQIGASRYSHSKRLKIIHSISPVPSIIENSNHCTSYSTSVHDYKISELDDLTFCNSSEQFVSTRKSFSKSDSVNSVHSQHSNQSHEYQSHQNQQYHSNSERYPFRNLTNINELESHTIQLIRDNQQPLDLSLVKLPNSNELNKESHRSQSFHGTNSVNTTTSNAVGTASITNNNNSITDAGCITAVTKTVDNNINNDSHKVKIENSLQASSINTFKTHTNMKNSCNRKKIPLDINLLIGLIQTALFTLENEINVNNNKHNTSEYSDTLYNDISLLSKKSLNLLLTIGSILINLTERNSETNDVDLLSNQHLELQTLNYSVDNNKSNNSGNNNNIMNNHIIGSVTNQELSHCIKNTLNNATFSTTTRTHTSVTTTETAAKKPAILLAISPVNLDPSINYYTDNKENQSPDKTQFILDKHNQLNCMNNTHESNLNDQHLRKSITNRSIKHFTSQPSQYETRVDQLNKQQTEFSGNKLKIVADNNNNSNNNNNITCGIGFKKLDDNESLITCPVCGFDARWFSELRAHMVNHSEHRMFGCCYCHYRAKWKWDVAKHMRRCPLGRHVSHLQNEALLRMVKYYAPPNDDILFSYFPHDGFPGVDVDKPPTPPNRILNNSFTCRQYHDVQNNLSMNDSKFDHSSVVCKSNSDENHLISKSFDLKNDLEILKKEFSIPQSRDRSVMSDQEDSSPPSLVIGDLDPMGTESVDFAHNKQGNMSNLSKNDETTHSITLLSHSSPSASPLSVQKTIKEDSKNQPSDASTMRLVFKLRKCPLCQYRSTDEEEFRTHWYSHYSHFSELCEIKQLNQNK